MPRRARQYIPQLPYHIVQRGNFVLLNRRIINSIWSPSRSYPLNIKWQCAPIV